MSLRRYAILLSLPVLFVAACARPIALDPVDREIENLRAFAKLYGYVRWFHPSDEAATTDWDRFAVDGAAVVHDARTADELRERLDTLFHPIAPTVVVTSARGSAPRTRQECRDATGSVYWQHLGVHLGSESNIYRSHRVGRTTEFDAQVPGRLFGMWIQAVDATPYRGRAVRLRAATRVDGEYPGSGAQLWLRVDRAGGEIGFFDNMSDRPIAAREWSIGEITGTIDDDADHLVFGGLVRGPGRVWFDAFEIHVEEAGDWVPIDLVNPNFDAAPDDATGWHTGGHAHAYRFELTDADAFVGDRALMIDGRPEKIMIDAPLFAGEPSVDSITRDIGSGLTAIVPIVVADRDDRTCPSGSGADSESIQRLDDVHRFERYAAVLIAWSALQHFYPYFDVVDADWDGELTKALVGAREARDERDFLKTLQALAAALQDGHAMAMHPVLGADAALPFAVALVQDRVVVTAASDGVPVQPGDIVIAVDGRAATEVFDAAQRYMSGSDWWRRATATQFFGFGPRGSDAVIDIVRGSHALTITVARDGRRTRESRTLDVVERVDDGVWYIDLTRSFQDRLAEHADDVFAARGLIVDMRGYPVGGAHWFLGHLSESPLASAVWQIPQVLYPDREGLTFKVSRLEIPPTAPRFDGQVVFLTDSTAISYSETIMGIVEHYQLGEILGAPTAGANGNVNIIPLPGGFRINFTGMKVLKHDGSQFHLVGIQPTVPVERTIAGVREGRDEVLERAVEVIKAGR